MMNEKMDILMYLAENNFLVTASIPIEMIAESYTVEELRELLKKFAEME